MSSRLCSCSSPLTLVVAAEDALAGGGALGLELDGRFG